MSAVSQLVASTIMNYHKTWADNVTNTNALLALLRKGNRKRTVPGGRKIACPLAFAEEDFTWYVGGGIDNTAPSALPRLVQETLGEASYDPYTAVASITLTGPDLAKNRGRERILSLLEGKLENAERTMSNNISLAVYGDGSVTNSFPGLGLFVVDDPSTGTVGGIDRATYAYWRNQVQNAGVTPDYAALRAAMNTLWLACIRGNEKPDLIAADGYTYSTLEGGMQENQRYADAYLGALGFETLKYKTASVVYDEPDSGQVAASGMQFLNSKYMKFEVYSGRDFEPLDLPDSTPDMDAITRHIAFMGALTMSAAMMQGKLGTHA